MKESDFRNHVLKDFFEARPGALGYQAKMVKTGLAGAGLSRMLSLDHVVPQRWGGIDHPRNYVAMHCSMNCSFGSAMPEEKWAYISRSVTRRVAAFFKGVRESKAVKEAIELYIQKDMPLI